MVGMRKKTPPAEAGNTAVIPPLPHVIHLHAFYSSEDVQRIFNIKKSGLREEIKAKRLRVSKLCGRYRFLGRWLIEWIESGELRAKKPAGVHSPVAAQECGNTGKEAM